MSVTKPTVMAPPNHMPKETVRAVKWGAIIWFIFKIAIEIWGNTRD